MIPLDYMLAVSFALFAVGLGGIAVDRHLVVIVIGIELIIVASIIALVAFLATNQQVNSDALIMLLALFTVAAVEVIAVITFYVYMKAMNVEFDVTKLSRMKW